MVRVLLVVDGVANEGASRVLDVRAIRAQRRGDEVRLSTSGVGSKADGAADYVRVRSDAEAAQASLQIVDPALSTVRRAVREFRPDVVVVDICEIRLSTVIFATLDPWSRSSTSRTTSDLSDRPEDLPDGTRCVDPTRSRLRAVGSVGPAHWTRTRAMRLIGRA